MQRTATILALATLFILGGCGARERRDWGGMTFEGCLTLPSEDKVDCIQQAQHRSMDKIVAATEVFQADRRAHPFVEPPSTYTRFSELQASPELPTSVYINIDNGLPSDRY